MKKLSLLLGATLALFCGSALADTRTGSFTASANVARSCKIVSTQAVAFGEYDSTNLHSATPLDAESQISVICTRGASGIHVYIGDGLNRVPGSPDNAPTRRMKSGSNFLHYQAFTNTQRTNIWTNNTHGVNAYWAPATFASSLDAVTQTAYLRLYAGQSVPTGNYSDALNVIIVF